MLLVVAVLLLLLLLLLMFLLHERINSLLLLKKYSIPNSPAKAASMCFVLILVFVAGTVFAPVLIRAQTRKNINITATATTNAIDTTYRTTDM